MLLTTDNVLQPSQIPQHVAAQISHLASRPGVQSTLILSRKDGSIIQVTGELAPRPSANTPLKQTTSPSGLESLSSISIDEASTPASTEAGTPTTTTTSATPNAPYKPTQVEVLAANIYAFVSSASALSTVLSNPSSEDANNEAGRMEDRDAEAGSGREHDDEVQLLRLRTKSHEILIMPDRRFLLCVVHDVSIGSGGGNPSHRR